mmetsp:Transcript_1792/g.3444  ORF Transcript_1792/g.3444 Transcript_1792/m.3444 type:complete len:242 (-) Transcript_1792:601-1326(-)
MIRHVATFVSVEIEVAVVREVHRACLGALSRNAQYDLVVVGEGVAGYDFHFPRVSIFAVRAGICKVYERLATIDAAAARESCIVKPRRSPVQMVPTVIIDRYFVMHTVDVKLCPPRPRRLPPDQNTEKARVFPEILWRLTGENDVACIREDNGGNGCSVVAQSDLHSLGITQRVECYDALLVLFLCDDFGFRRCFLRGPQGPHLGCAQNRLHLRTPCLKSRFSCGTGCPLGGGIHGGDCRG